MPENLISRNGFGSPVPRQPAHLHIQTEYGAYLRDSSRVPRQRPFIYFKASYAIGSVPGLSGHAIAYLWRSLPRVRRHRASKPQGNSERVLPWQVTMDQLPCAFLSQTHYSYEVGMLKVPAANMDPNTVEAGSNRICCFRVDVGVFSCAFESTTKLPSGIAAHPAHVGLSPRQRGLSSVRRTLSI